MAGQLRTQLTRAAALLGAAALVFVGSADAQTGMGGIGFPSGGDPFGHSFAGGLQPISPTQPHGLLDSTYTLSNVDLATGTLISDHVAHPLTTQYAAQLDLLNNGQLAIDTADLANQARLIAAAQRNDARRSGVAIERRPNPGTPADHEMMSFSDNCHPGNANYRARIETVLAFEQMCQAALDDGVVLQINSAYRSPERQRQLFERAVSRYGSHAAARRWVAYSDGTTCTSRHCSGDAVDINMRQAGGHDWLHEPVGCYATHTGTRLGDGNCGSGESVVVRGNLYGMVAPLSHEPWHWELGIPLAGDVTGANCTPDSSYNVQQMIAAIWRCELAQAGYSGAEIDRTVAEALVVAHCESGFNASARVMGGRYLNARAPDGYYYSASGVFQMTRGVGSYIPGGHDNALDPAANITGAARLYLDRGWQPWACVNPPAPGDAGYEYNSNHSVLYNPDGTRSTLPDWAWQY